MCDSHITFYCCNTLMCNTCNSGVKWFSPSLIFTPCPKEVGVLPPNYRHRVYVDSAFLWEVTHLFEGRSHGQKTVLKQGVGKASFFLEKVVNGHFIQDPFCKQRLWSFFLVWPQQTLIGLTAEPWVVFDLQLILLCLPSHPWCCRW